MRVAQAENGHPWRICLLLLEAGAQAEWYESANSTASRSHVGETMKTRFVLFALCSLLQPLILSAQDESNSPQETVAAFHAVLSSGAFAR